MSTAEVAPPPVPSADGRPHRTRVGLLTEHQQLLETLVAGLAAHAPDFAVVVAERSWQALVHSPAFPTEVVLTDFQVAEAPSIEARIRTCRTAGAAVVVLSSLHTDEARERSLAAGAAEFLTTAASIPEVVDAVRRTLGRAAGGPESWRPAPLAETAPPRPKLSPGEAQALKLYAAGLSTREVGERMNVQYETAKTFLRRVRQKYAKLGRPAGKKTELVRRAAEDGFLDR